MKTLLYSFTVAIYASILDRLRTCNNIGNIHHSTATVLLVFFYIEIAVSFS